MSKPEKAVIVNNFIFANFNHNPVVWYFCSGNSTKKTEKIQKRYFRILLDVYESDYDHHQRKVAKRQWTASARELLQLKYLRL